MMYSKLIFVACRAQEWRNLQRAPGKRRQPDEYEPERGDMYFSGR